MKVLIQGNLIDTEMIISVSEPREEYNDFVRGSIGFGFTIKVPGGDIRIRKCFSVEESHNAGIASDIRYAHERLLEYWNGETKFKTIDI